MSLPPFPLTVLKLHAVGAMLKAGGYRSPANYFSRAKEEHVVQGFQWSDALHLAVCKATMSITRGIGPARQSAPINVVDVWNLDMPWEPPAAGMPLGGKLLLVAGAFFCAREIELSLALRCHLSVNPVAKQVSWNLPCSKTDPWALGKTRTWDCVCDGSLDVPCAFHALARHCTYLDQKFSSTPHDALPLFPVRTGSTVEKAMVVKLIEAAASQLGLPLTSEDGRNIYGGHSLRVSGAQWLAQMAIPLPLIQLMARWASDVIAWYVAEVPLTTISSIYRRSGCNEDLQRLIQRAHQSEENARTEIEKMSAAFRESFIDELRTATACAPRQEGAAGLSLPYVVRCGGGKTHAVGNRAVGVLAVHEWRTRCGWKFGLADFTFSATAGPRHDRCSTCFKPTCADGGSSSSG